MRKRRQQQFQRMPLPQLCVAHAWHVSDAGANLSRDASHVLHYGGLTTQRKEQAACWLRLLCEAQQHL